MQRNSNNLNLNAKAKDNWFDITYFATLGDMTFDLCSFAVLLKE